MNVYQKLIYKVIEVVYVDNLGFGVIFMQYKDQFFYGVYDEDWCGGNIMFNGKVYIFQSQYYFLDFMDYVELIIVDFFGDGKFFVVDMVQQFYDQVVQFWKQGKKEEVMFYFGRVVYIFEDMSMFIVYIILYFFEIFDEFSYVEEVYDFVENDIFLMVVDDIFNNCVFFDFMFIKWWQIFQEKQRFIIGEDIYVVDNENGYMDFFYGVVWVYVDMIVYNVWCYMFYFIGKDINFWSECGYFGSYFWMKEFKKGDWSIFKFQFFGVSLIIIVFKDIDMQNVYFKIFGYVEIYDKNWNFIVCYVQDLNLLVDMSVIVLGDIVYIYIYVDKDDWFDDDVDGWVIRNIEFYVNFDVNVLSGFKIFDGREYSKVQWVVYEIMQYDIRVVVGFMEKFFEDVGVSG